MGLVLVLFAIGLAVIGFGAPAGAAWCASLPAAAAVPDWRAAKKGVGTWQYDGASSALSSAGLSWFYTWKAGLDGVDQPPGTSFVPMIWGAGTADAASLAQARTHGDTLLGFNEPDVVDQANMTVEQALDLWPQLESTGQRLGSPAVSANGATAGGWLDRFMTGASQRGYRVDFVTVHWYGANFTDPVGEARDLCRYVTAVYERYRKPVWLTEFALADFRLGVQQARYPSDGEQAAFVRAALPLLQRLPHLERYAWFALANTASSYRTGLYANAATLTPAGDAYLSAGKEPPSDGRDP